MQELFDAIKNRRSIRKYQSKPIPQNLIEEILVATNWAPSAHNAQPWRFIILDDPAVKRALSKDMAQSWVADMSKDGVKIGKDVYEVRVERFASAPVAILACSTMDSMYKQPDAEREKVERDLAMQSLGAAMQNLLLAAYAKGLGACWFCAPAFCKAIVRGTLGIPKEVEPQALILMGYTSEEAPVPIRKALSDYAFKNKWGLKFS